MRINNLRFFLMFLLFLIILLIIGKYFIDIVVRENERAAQYTDDTGPYIVEEERISWEEIVEKVKSCEVSQVFQTHDLRVSIYMDDGTVYWGYEPAIDDILNLAEQASQDCNKDILRVTE